MKITLLVGTRPNFVKVSPLLKAIKEYDFISYRLIHSGQHYDRELKDIFFEELEIPLPSKSFELKNKTTPLLEMTFLFCKDLEENKPDLVIVFGDCNTTLAGAIATKMKNIPLAHIEAGIRSFDDTMPEELNRILTDKITDYFFTTTEIANQNLLNEGLKKENMFFVGNIMADTIFQNIEKLKKPNLFDELNLISKRYFILTLHRPSNVDDNERLQQIIRMINDCLSGVPLLFPVHPRTKKRLNNLILYPNIHFIEPLSYLEFNYLVKNAMGVITDSGGIQEETTIMNIPCITIRENTERPETCVYGTNELTNIENIPNLIKKIIANKWKKGQIPEMWDGKTSYRILNIINKIYND